MIKKLALFLALFSALALAQSTTPKTGTDVPDNVAYRMVFLSLSAPTVVHPTIPGMSSADQKALNIIAATFFNQHQAVDKSVAAGSMTALTHHAQRNNITQSAVAQAKSLLSPAGYALFVNYVQDAKNRMKTLEDGN